MKEGEHKSANSRLKGREKLHVKPFSEVTKRLGPNATRCHQCPRVRRIWGCVGERGLPEVGSEKGRYFQSMRSCAHLLVKSESLNAFDKQAGWPPHSGTSWDIWFIERLTNPGRRRGEGAGPIIWTRLYEPRGAPGAWGQPGTGSSSRLSTWAPRPRTHQSRRGSGAKSPEGPENREAQKSPTGSPEPWWGQRAAARQGRSCGPPAARRPLPVSDGLGAPQVPARLPSWLRWRRPGSCGAAVEGAAALGEVGPPRAEEPPTAAPPPPLSKESQATPGTTAAAWIIPVHPTLVSPLAPPVPGLSCFSTRYAPRGARPGRGCERTRFSWSRVPPGCDPRSEGVGPRSPEKRLGDWFGFQGDGVSRCVWTPVCF